MQSNINDVFEEGIKSYENGDMETAEKSFLAALQADPTSDEIKYNLALVYLEMKKYAHVDKIISQIRETDCDEIIDALEKAGYDHHPEIPENVPDTCEKCDHFDAENPKEEDQGFCAFYEITVKNDSQCHVYKLAEEGVIPFEMLSPNINGELNEQIKLYHNLLDDQYLPEKIICDNCAVELELNETDRMAQQYSCPECGFDADIRVKVENLIDEFGKKPDRELFQIMIHAGDYKNEYLLAAKKEIKKRNIDLFNHEEFERQLTVV